MNSKSMLVKCLLPAAVLVLSMPLETLGADKLPADRAGTIGEPTGRIAFIREGNVWIMNADGSQQQMIVESSNADGRLSWAPDGKRIAFTRSGRVDLKGPDAVVGGMHKVYDIFVAFLDSAYHNNRLWWLRLTDDLGSRGPEWSEDGGTIIFSKDMNANYVNAAEPNYQVCTMASDGSDFQVLRKDWRNMGGDFLLAPTMSADSMIAAVAFIDKRPTGLVILPHSGMMAPVDTIRAQAQRNAKLVAPSWSPDGKWLALINNDLNDGGLYIATPELKERFLVFSPPVGAYLYPVAPSFSPDSKWLTFSTNDGSVWICDIAGTKPRRLTGPGLDKFPAWSKAEPQ